MQRHRPLYPRINMRAPLANGLVFAGLGGGASTNAYLDSSPYGNHGTLTGMIPATDWLYDPQLGRPVLRFDGSDAYGRATIRTSSTITLSCWLNVAGGDYGYAITNSTSTPNYGWQFGWLGDATVGWKFSNNDDTMVKISKAYTTTNTWFHILAFSSPGQQEFFFNGISQGTSTTAGNLTWQNAYIDIGAIQSLGRYLAGKMADVCIWFSDQRAAAKAVADPSNVMLSGLVLPPRRRLWAVSGGAAPASNYLLTLRAANKRGNKLGGTLIGKQT